MSLLSVLARRLAARAAEKDVARTAARDVERAVARPNPLAVQRPLALPAPPRPKALPAPPKHLALPAPGPGLPAHAAKPRGGQWYADVPIVGQNYSAAQAARGPAAEFGLSDAQFVPEQPGGDWDYLRTESPREKWLQKALTRYYQNDFGAPDDPLRDLAERGLHYDPDMTPSKWTSTVNSYLIEDPLQHLLFPRNHEGGMPGAGDDLRGEVMAKMPWLAKQPATGTVYGMQGGPDLGHFTDELQNALNADVSGLPPELSLRDQSLGRMSFPQAVEHVGKINQWRAAEMAKQRAAGMGNPAVHTFKEYPENNPRGLRWVELKAPAGSAPYRSKYAVRDLDDDALLNELSTDPDAGHAALRDALRYEGDAMGHCVGGYCDDVLSGKSRIFSLRDAEGGPHVTIETAPGAKYRDLEHAADEDPDIGDAWNQLHYGEDPAQHATPFRREDGSVPTFEEYLQANHPDLYARATEPQPDNIIQIKGKQNRAPNDAYLPFVQDFVKSGTWGNVGDMKNTGLVARLPDNRFLTQAQIDEISRSPAAVSLFGSDANAARQLAPWNLHTYSPEDWEATKHLFEGYAFGGRVARERDFSRNPLAVR